MPDTKTDDVPTHYANIVTVTVDPDVAYLELRRYIRPHREFFVPSVPSPSEPAEGGVFDQEPIARVVLTYSAAKALHATLGDLLPKMEQERRSTGQP
jgi:hypothetical protein